MSDHNQPPIQQEDEAGLSNRKKNNRRQRQKKSGQPAAEGTPLAESGELHKVEEVEQSKPSPLGSGSSSVVSRSAEKVLLAVADSVEFSSASSPSGIIDAQAVPTPLTSATPSRAESSATSSHVVAPGSNRVSSPSNSQRRIRFAEPLISGMAEVDRGGPVIPAEPSFPKRLMLLLIPLLLLFVARLVKLMRK